MKWLILLIPTFTVGLWEFIRHTPPMLSHVSMTTGNWLTAVIVLGVTILFVRKLFNRMEDLQKKLEEERAKKVMLEEREKIARQLHDGVAQSIFLLGVKMNQWEANEPHLIEHETYQKMRKTVQHMHEDVRQSIFNLRNPSTVHPSPWIESLQQLVSDIQQETGQSIRFQWDIPEEQLTSQEKIELYACVKEALMNIRKHAQADQVSIIAQSLEDGWVCTVEDNGVGFQEEDLSESQGYGMEIMQDRARKMGWQVGWQRQDNHTKVMIRKGLKTGESTVPHFNR